MKTYRIVVLSLCAFLACALPLSAQQQGADSAANVFSARENGAGSFVTDTGSSQAAALNPAAVAEEQLILIDGSYTAIPGLGSEAGLGHAASAGVVFPTKVAVFSGSLRFLHSPFTSMNLGTGLFLNAGVSKELYEGLSFGIAIEGGFGTDWALGADIGVRHAIGKLGPLHDFTWALSIGGLGKGWTPSAFTPIGGVSFDVLRIAGKEGSADPLRIGLAADFGVPGFQNFTAQLGLKIEAFRMFTLSASTGLNAVELMNGNNASFIPSVGLSFNLNLDREAKEGAAPRQGSFNSTLAARPLYNGTWAFSGGVIAALGVVDRKAPAITVQYPNPIWISPNNDGKADLLELPVSITDTRYVMEWSLDITNDKMEILRTIRNKERREESSNIFLSVFDRIVDVKSGVEIPEVIRWDGKLDSGETAPDGKYIFILSATDDNDNTAATESYTIWVDNTAPVAEIAAHREAMVILSPDGDGNKDTLPLNQSGSEEDSWKGSVLDAAGNAVRSWNWENTAPTAFDWDGKDDNGRVVPDGVYRYTLTTTDRAQNSATASLENIIVNTIRPTVALFIEDAWFSPNGDGVKDVMSFKPDVPVKEGIVSWTVDIGKPDGEVQATQKGGSTVPSVIEFDGKGLNGQLLAEGAWQAKLAVVYQNGNVSTAESPAFNLDITAPSAAVRAEVPAFSPNGDGQVDVLPLLQTGSSEEAWIGEIRDSSGTVVQSFTFNGSPAERLEWDGRGSSGALSPDGQYTYTLSATDQAGNRGSAQNIAFSLTTADTPVFVTTDLPAFSPNGDRVKDSISIAPQLQIKSGIANWKLEVLDAQGAVVRAWNGGGTAPGTMVWDGKTNTGTLAPDGAYTARVDIRYVAGNQPVAQSAAFTLDTKAPELSLEAPYTLFSPDGDSRKDTVPFNLETPGTDSWTAEILDKSGKAVRSWNWTGQAPQLAWDGSDSAGNILKDDTYSLEVRSEDSAGNKNSGKISGLTIDTRPAQAFMTASANGISPNGDGKADSLRLGLVVTNREGIESWKVEIQDAQKKAIRTIASGSGKDTIPARLDWDGKDSDGNVQEGSITASLSVSYLKGTLATAEAGPVLVDISAPIPSLATSPRYFSPDNDGVEDELSVRLAIEDRSEIESWTLEIREPQPPHLVFYSISGKGKPSESIRWDGRSNKGELVQAATDYPITFSATDVLGNTGEVKSQVSVDVLVIRDGDKLKIQVPSIIFRENGNDFAGLSQDKLDINDRVLQRIAQILNRFRDYKVKVEGHANPVSRTAAEERNELQPLSEARAKTIMEELIRYGVDRNRLSSVGMGGTRPVVAWEDRDNWWKNRRVEFILIK